MSKRREGGRERKKGRKDEGGDGGEEREECSERATSHPITLQNKLIR